MNGKSRMLFASFILLYGYTFWGFFLTETVFASSTIRYFISVIILVLMMLGLRKARKSKKRTIHFLGAIWLPFVLYTIIGWATILSINSMIYWIIALLLLYMSSKIEFEEYFPIKLIAVSGIIAVVGIIFQMAFSKLYYGRYIYIFNQTSISDIRSWAKFTGFAGFTYQLGMNAAILICGEGAFFFFSINETNIRRKRISMLLCIACIVGVFLTGKRTASVIALICPISVMVLAQKRNKNRIIYEMFFLFALVGTYYFLIYNVESLLNTRALGRIAESLISLQSGDDITSGRNQLFQSAISAFKENPILGIGVGRYATYTGQNTGVHNAYLQVLCEQGIIGILFFIFPLIIGLYTTIKLLRKNLTSNIKPYLCISLFYQFFYIIYSFTGNTNSDLFGFIMYFSGIAICIRSDKRTKALATLNSFNHMVV